VSFKATGTTNVRFTVLGASNHELNLKAIEVLARFKDTEPGADIQFQIEARPAVEQFGADAPTLWEGEVTATL
jgi:hypothetical protein